MFIGVWSPNLGLFIWPDLFSPLFLPYCSWISSSSALLRCRLFCFLLSSLYLLLSGVFRIDFRSDYSLSLKELLLTLSKPMSPPSWDFLPLDSENLREIDWPHWGVRPAALSFSTSCLIWRCFLRRRQTQIIIMRQITAHIGAVM